MLLYFDSNFARIGSEKYIQQFGQHWFWYKLRYECKQIAIQFSPLLLMCKENTHLEESSVFIMSIIWLSEIWEVAVIKFQA